MATLSNIAVKITANSGSYTSGTMAAASAAAKFASKQKEAEKKTSRFGKVARIAGKAAASAFKRVARSAAAAGRAVARMGSSVKSGLTGSIAKVGALVAAVSALGAGMAAVSFSRSTRELGTWSETLGVSVNTLQTWTAAAKTVGFQADKVTDIFKDTSEKLGDAFGAGGGEAAALFEDYGISFKEFIGLAPDKALQRLADVSTGLSKQKRIMMFESLANDASKLLPLLDKGGARFRALAADMRTYGTALNATQVKASTEFANQFDKLGSLVGNFGKQLTAELAPAFTYVVSGINNMIKDAGGIHVLAQKTAKTIARIASGILQIVNSIVPAFKSVYAAIAKAVRGMGGLGAAANFIKNSMIGLGKAASNGVTKVVGSISKMASEVAGMGINLDLVIAKYDILKAKAGLLMASFNKEDGNLNLNLPQFRSDPKKISEASLAQDDLLNAMERQTLLERKLKKMREERTKASVKGSVKEKSMEAENNGFFKDQINALNKFADSIGKAQVDGAVEVYKELDKTFNDKLNKQTKEEKSANKFKKKLEEQNELIKKQAQLMEKVKLEAEQLRGESSFSAGLKSLSDVLARSKDSSRSLSEQNEQRKLYSMALGSVNSGGGLAALAGGTGGAQKVEVMITVDEAGMITPVVNSKQLDDKVVTVVTRTVNKQAKLNDR